MDVEGEVLLQFFTKAGQEMGQNVSRAKIFLCLRVKLKKLGFSTQLRTMPALAWKKKLQLKFQI